ncbi:YIEGIA family protein [Salimicrobium halophilum]|uniref:YIEGIA protein n=1 Tax=Salimicrobium halophilum TaxID=86666 RepID=A0A1G8Q0C3_9BACI|nr:YIEGIA family protein [Salimicrobium halophilum]SDI97915.1 hypothetical protein SAMN04490247_0306 [Salimicrobium halophilum]
MNEYIPAIIYGVLFGTALRLFMLRIDYRQYPTYLHGRIIHLSLGFIAASLGTLAIPSVMEEQYTAVTFLTIAASQFREVRNMERNTLNEMDAFELVPRGNTYIEGIAIAFESRNYLVIASSLLVTSFYVFIGWYAAVIVSIICIIGAQVLMSGSSLGKITEIERAELTFKGAGLYVDSIYIMNIGLPERQKEILEYGMGFIVTPKSFSVRSTIANLGQRQAILHDLSVTLGVFRDSGTPALVPLIKRDLNDGRIGVFILPQEKNLDTALSVLAKVPVLEHAVQKPHFKKEASS